jgi:phosphoribosylformylglycinamidine (FGAM) synthase PurS component
MAEFIVEITPKKASYDPLARTVRAELLEDGESPQSAHVVTSRLFRLQGDLSKRDVETIAIDLLVDPVVENSSWSEVSSKSPKKEKGLKGCVIDVWPKSGVTDPVGDTLQKSLKDLGIHKDVVSSSAIRYIFPKAKDPERLRSFAKRVLANSLIHDINIRKIN